MKLKTAAISTHSQSDWLIFSAPDYLCNLGSFHGDLTEKILEAPRGII